MSTITYPKSPASLPKKLTSLTPSYQVKAFLAILSILLFFILYTALVISLGYLAYYSFIYEIDNINKITILMKIGAIAGSVMLFIFTLKFIFKLKNVKRVNRIKLDKKEQPEMWSFILKICQETGAPKPKSIYVDPDVNAYVSYTNMWLSLFLPVRKELTIGLGLVDCLNMSEFKAVMSHEFGHFAQKSMKIGSYIISANTIIHDMIFSRDSWDELLDKWRASDIRLSAAAWLITPIIWVIRLVLSLFYQFLNIMYSSLSREMEFNADKVAISTSGSDAIVSALWKLDTGFTKWNSTVNHAYLATQKKIYTKNLYTHNALEHERGLPELLESLEKLPEDKRGGKVYFSNSEHSKVGMYASHPPNDKRQENAKVPFISCESDDRSPWILFNEKEQLQVEMTKLIYKQYLDKENFEITQIEDFENFIKTENQGKELLEEYENTFENRYLQIPEILDLEKETRNIALNSGSLLKIKSDLKKLMKPVKDIEKLMILASQISEGTTKTNSFSFKSETYQKKNIQEGYTTLFNEREKLFNEDFKNWDTEFCAFHLSLAKKLNQEEHLINLYTQHKEFSKFYKEILMTKGTIYHELEELQSKDDLQENQVWSFSNRVNQMFTNLNKPLAELEKCTFVPLPNIETIQELKEAVIDGGEFIKEKGNIFENGGFNTLMTSLENSVVQCQRIDQKSIGVILSFHRLLQEKL